MRAILTYHSIDASGSPISISPGIFREHVRWMAQGPAKVTSLAELVADEANDDTDTDAVAVTFDDGFANFADAAKQLADHGLPATVFIVTGHVGGTNAWRGRSDPGIPTLPLLSWEELERLVAGGVTMGAHTRTHAVLTSLPSAAVEDEMDRCSEELQARLGVHASSFAYPYGAVDERIAALAGRRYLASVTTRFAPLAGPSPPMWIPRFDMHYFRRPGALHAWGTASFARHVWSVRARRRLREMLR